MRKLASMLLIGVIWCPGAANALGLGELTLSSFLNEPLQAEVELLELGDLDPSQVKVRLATREDFSRAGVERDYFLTSLRFVVQSSGSSAKLVITSTLPVREPYLNFIIEARWPTGRLLREYTVLLDPPVFVGSERGITARASSGQPATSRQSAPQPSAGASETGSPSSSRPRPVRTFGAGAADTPISGEEYVVKRNDTLWQIAQAGRPAGASVQQTMLDILRLNPEAFINGNINRVKAGYVLRLPTADQITARSPQQAVAEVAAQQQRWQRGASDVDTRLDASESVDYGASGATGRGEGHLQIAAPEEAGDGAASGEISAQMEDLDRARRENAELSTRVGSLEQQMQMQKRLIALKDEQIAALQEALASAGGEAPDVASTGQTGALGSVSEDTATGTDIDALDVETPDTRFTEGEDAAEGPVIEPMPDAGDTATDAAVQEEPRPAPAPVRRPAPQPSLVDLLMENILAIGGGLLLLLLALLYFLRKRLPGFKRSGDQPQPARAGADDEDEFAGVRLSDDSLIVDEFAEDADGEPGATESIGGFSPPDEEAYAAQFETGDALAEADIYIAYGRFPQAVDLLKTAISVEPANTDYRMKLMEACVETVDREEFQQQYADLQVIGDEHVIARARDLLDAVDGGEVWLEDLPPPTISEADVAVARALTHDDEGAGADDQAPDELRLEEDEDFDLGTVDETEQAGRKQELDLDLGSLDETLDLDESGLDETGLEAADAADAADIEDLDLDLEFDDLDDLDEEGEDDLRRIEYEVDSQAQPDVEGLDELELEDADTESPVTASQTREFAGENVQDDALDLAKELGGIDIEDASDEIALPDLELDSQPAAGTDGLEQVEDELLSGLDDLELDLGDLQPEESDEEAVSLDDLDLSLDEEEGDQLFDLSEESDAASRRDAADAGDELDLGSLEDDAAPDMDLGSLDTESTLEDLDLDVPDADRAPGDTGLDLGASGDESDLDGAELSLDDLDSAADLDSLELDMSDMPDMSEDDAEEEGLVYAANGDEVATKLDLARAYLDMGDHDGAKSILDEVVEEGSEAQQAEARALLEGID